MKKETVVLNFDKGKLEIEAQVCDNPFSKSRGLMFRKLEDSPILVFKFHKEIFEAIHSFFVPFRFLAVWIDERGNVFEKKMVKPFSPYIIPRQKFKTLVEIPISEGNKKILDDIERFK